MANRLIVLEVPDVRTEDDLVMAVEIWNEEQPDRQVWYRKIYSTTVGDPIV